MLNAERFVLITGATDGIGRATAVALARAGWNVLLHGRDDARLRATRDDIAGATGNPNIDWVRADFSRLGEVRALGAYLADNYDRLDVLINNAATLQPARHLTEDGHELTFQVNHLAPFVLTRALLPMLQSTAQTHGEARIVNLAANGHLKVKLALDDLNNANDYNGVTAYQRSKLANVLFTKSLARGRAGAGVTANALHPGVITTKVLMAGFGITGAPPEDGAAAVINMATSAELRGATGRYFDMLRERKGVAATADEADQDALWAATERLLGAV
jgi:NAD(P)-dependent dehydrogenase (short-subunit alcohol dehydrogenase family)